MATYLVTYDLSNPEQKYKNVLNEIKKYSWTQLSESSYAISTSLSENQIFKNLSPNLDSNDQLYIITLSKPYRGRGAQEVNSWLEKFL